MTIQVIQERLRKGDYAKARQISIEFLKQNAALQVDQACALHYYLGVATCMLGNIPEGMRILKPVVDDCRNRSNSVPNILSKNMNYFRIAQKNGDSSRLRKLIDVTTPYVHPFGELIGHYKLARRDNKDLRKEIQAAIEFHRIQKTSPRS